MLVIAVMTIIMALALPSASNALQGYRLHSDAASVASFLNLARMRAASQYAPYRLSAFVDARTYSIEKLCGNTPTSTDAACTSPYSSFTTPQIEQGTQYLSQDSNFSTCEPTAISTFPGTTTANPACVTVVRFYFNTRGTPVDNTGNPVPNGGVVVYLTSAKNSNLVDAVTVAVAGQVTVWNWSNNQWNQR